MRPPSQRSAAFTVMELVIACSVFAILVVFAHLLLSRSMEGMGRASERMSTRKQMRRIAHVMRPDIEAMAGNQLEIGAAASNLAGADGDAIWGLSARDDQGRFHLRPDGRPFWQNQILYYCTIPQNFDTEHYQGAGVQVDGYEVSFPFKQLVRRVIDEGAPTDPSNPDTREQLSGDLSHLFVRPNNLRIAPHPKVSDDRIVATSLLSFRVDREPDGAVVVTFSGYSPEAKKRRLGSSDLRNSVNTRTSILRIYPKQTGST